MRKGSGKKARFSATIDRKILYEIRRISRSTLTPTSTYIEKLLYIGMANKHSNLEVVKEIVKTQLEDTPMGIESIETKRKTKGWDETKLDKLPSPEMGKCDGFCDDNQKLLIAISKNKINRYCAECAKWIMEED